MIEDDSKVFDISSTISDISKTGEFNHMRNCSVDLVPVTIEEKFLQNVTDEDTIPEVKQEDETAIKREPQEETVPDESLCNIEQQLSDVVLNEDAKTEEETMPVVEEEPKQSDDVEMKAEPELNIIDALPPAVPKEEPHQEVQVAKEESEMSFIDFMDFEDETPLVRRSRRLQTAQVEPAPVKIEEISLAAVIEEVKEEILPAEKENSEKTDIKLESSQAEPEFIQPIDMQQPEPVARLEYTDERLKRYENIRDNIYPKKSDKKVCKVNKTMKCDCTITEEEVKSGELGCQFNCINRLLYIECGSKCRCGGELLFTKLLCSTNDENYSRIL